MDLSDLLSEHAAGRISERRIKESTIDRAIHRGKKALMRTSPGCIALMWGGFVVIVTEDLERVVTAFKKQRYVQVVRRGYGGRRR